MSIFKLPDLGEGLPDAEINQWHVQEGDFIKADALLVSMETAKAVVDVPAPQSGKIVKLYGKAGDIIKTGAPLVEFESSESTQEKPKSDAGTVVGKMESANTVIAEERFTKSSNPTATAVKALPAVRALAKQLNVDLTALVGTGANGQITSDDVKNASGNSSSTSSSSFTPLANAIIEPIRGVRRAMANTMIQSHAEVVPVTVVDDADLHAWPKGTDITARVIRAITHACKKEPSLNAHFSSKNLERHIYNEVHIGMAMDTKDGLFVPVIKNAEKMNLADIRKTIERYKEEVKTRAVPQDDLKGSTIQVSNFGTFAGRYANPTIVPPIVAILGTGRIRFEAVVEGDKIAAHKIIPLSLTVDHRAVTGGEATRFLAAVIEDLQKPE